MVQATSETFDDIIQLRTHEKTQNTVNRLKLRSKEGAKHFLVQIVRQMDEKRIKEIGCHLQSLTPQLGTYFFKYIESRQGKDFTNYLVFVYLVSHFIYFSEQIDDIERHGPPSAYDEDSFEKNHGRIKNQIFLQYQRARSRDTASNYAQHMLCHHVVRDGYFKHEEIWKQASATTLHAGCDPVVESFLGWKDEPSRTWNHTEV
ncbi:uncharacterized protein LOC144618457 [Crassostrea virginica]